MDIIEKQDGVIKAKFILGIRHSDRTIGDLLGIEKDHETAEETVYITEDELPDLMYHAAETIVTQVSKHGFVYQFHFGVVGRNHDMLEPRLKRVADSINIIKTIPEVKMDYHMKSYLRDIAIIAFAEYRTRTDMKF